MTCTVAECSARTFGRGLCQKHYTRMRRHGDTSTVLQRGPEPQSNYPCSVDGCETPARSLGLCSAHHHRLHRHGSPTAGTAAKPRGTVLDRLLAKVDKEGPIPERWPELGPCWVWTGYTCKGYGVIGTTGRKLGLTHRVAYEQLIGPIPDGLELDHLCVNPPCCNPAHMEPVTHAENVRRAVARAKGESLCRS